MKLDKRKIRVGIIQPLSARPAFRSPTSRNIGVLRQNAIGLVVALFVAVWVGFSLWHSVPFASVETDGMEYIATAQSLFTPHFSYSSYHGIGYPLAIWLVHLLLNDWFLSAKLTSGIAGLIFLVMSYQLIERLFGRPPALLGALLILTNFFVVAYSGIAMADMPGAALGLSALVILIRSQSAERYAWAGALAGAAAVTRYQYLGLVLAVSFVWIFESNNRARIRAVLLYAAAFSVVILPFLILNWRTFGNPLFNSNYHLIGGWVYRGFQAPPASSWNDIATIVASDPKTTVFRYLRKVGFDLPLFWMHIVYYASFFGLAGWIWALRNKLDRPKLLTAVGFFVAYVSVTAISWTGSERYWIFVIPLIIGGCAFFVAQLSIQNWKLGLGLLLLLISVNLVGAIDNFPSLASEQAPEFQRAGEVIRKSAAPDSVILVSQPQIAYFAERPSVLLRDVARTWGELPKVIAQHRVGFVVMDERYGAGHYAELQPLLNAELVSQAFPQWQLVYREDSKPRIVVYRTSTPPE